jgi:hypothetical protein
MVEGGGGIPVVSNRLHHSLDISYNRLQNDNKNSYFMMQNILISKNYYKIRTSGTILYYTLLQYNEVRIGFIQ